MIEIKPITGTVDAIVTVPGSKSYTNRALITAALADGESTITNALFSDDTKYMASSLNVLGIPIEEQQDVNKFIVHGKGGTIPARQANLFVGNAGTAMRFLTAMLTLGNGVYEIDGVTRMRQRPIQDLLDGLRQLGADVISKHNDGCPPVIIRGKGLNGGLAVVKGDLSSQYFSALLMTAPCAKKDVIIEVKGNLVSKRYVDMTVALMREFGVNVENNDYKTFFVKSGQHYKATHYEVEGDASAASYFFAAAAITGGKVRVVGIGSDSLQGDIHFVDVLKSMGCKVVIGSNWVEVLGNSLHGVDVDMGDMPDVVQTLAAVAVFAHGKTRVRNVKTMRIKETDRIAAVVNELRRMGISAVEYEDGFEIEPSPPRPAQIETYDDHRMAMSFALIGLRSTGISIKNPECVSKTFPDYFQRLEALRGGL
ncbi:MAG: 3-phosphoshikimate 1-carboxyvinyltransferase [Candidatus Brocadia sp. AMX2]|uniref:3-phosphoshikimate 1-carboxyvinyltransferase n=1 Tax=Candidatus Brocadia sp. AMX2 TaxID=2293635 RepID=UPI00079503A1|nr:3-phosphoshikimate 1-carboxyvinyltransferase [Candidatus Brocadia sp. AMX2]KXK27201.1 MAG: 3-phosphoshikimate 1-carboxyvinyltransferase [Candidatus Brocadia sinica]MBC6933804.1 3-phosphoshikimate 1-carboxyvinyltransferase [Candidatus Brocadia sp.]MBL1170550.1 3-phosphoshikimate 1-carboxyvinyltransferase [Candidatus Brocadia sp. AMX1]NOG42074.1 3-phosphoshikimate 1-carboxyvinyltransferase [Planctomycetota bacterium]KAA0242418.1 MAG: 3-phosphoshikimate 1-carboxyvinyltransferase [Candidatus Br